MARTCRCGFWDVIIQTAILASRIAMGLELGSVGPVLLYLADNVNTSVSELSAIFLARSIGIVVGAAIGGVIVRKTSSTFRHLYPQGAVLVFLGVSTSVVPHIKSLWALILLLFIGGILYGYLDSGIQALILQLFGDKGSRAYVQLFHFGFSAGAFFGPLLAKPFLEMYDSEKPIENQCPTNGDEQLNTTGEILKNDTEIFTTPANGLKIPDGDPMLWMFYIIGILMALVGGIFAILGKLNVEGKIKTSGKDNRKKVTSEMREEEPLKDVLLFFIVVMMFFYCAVSAENVFYFYLYPVSICSGLKLSIETASILNSVMWLGLGVGRLVGTLVASFITPRKILLFAVAGSILDSLLMCIFGETSLWLVWIIAFAHLFTTGMFYPAGVSWTASVTNVSQTYQFIFTIGSSLGGMTMLPLAGHIFSLNPFSVMYLVFALAAANALILGGGVWVARRHKRKVKRRSQDGMVKDQGVLELEAEEPILCD